MKLRAGAAVLAAAGLALTGCSSATPSASPSTNAWGNPLTPTVSPSASAGTATAAPTASPSAPTKVDTTLDAIKVDGAAGAEPTITVPSPWAIDATKTKILEEGSGPVVKDTGTVYVHYTGVNGRTGKVFDSSFKAGQPISFSLTGVVPGFQKGLTGQKAGTRLIIAMPGPDGYDKSGGSPQAGIQVGDTLIFVVEVIDTPADAAWGAPVPAKEGLPAVSGDATNPQVTVTPGLAAPTDTLVQPILTGAPGHKVAATDTVTVRYNGYSAKTGKLVQSNWSAEKPDSGQLSRLIPGWRKGLTGQNVGSRVLLVVPPADAYPQGNATPAIEAGDTLVYVIDILWSGTGQ